MIRQEEVYQNYFPLKKKLKEDEIFSVGGKLGTYYMAVYLYLCLFPLPYIPLKHSVFCTYNYLTFQKILPDIRNTCWYLAFPICTEFYHA